MEFCVFSCLNNGSEQRTAAAAMSCNFESSCNGNAGNAKDGLTAMQLAFNAGEHRHGGQFGWTCRK